MADREQTFPYQRVVDGLRSEILGGQRGPGDLLPSEHELAASYGTSRPTVRRALARLKAEGLVVTRQGQGTFVRPTPHVRLLLTGGSYRKHRGLGLPGFNAQVLEQGLAPKQQLLSVTTVEASQDVAIRLELGDGTLVVARNRLFLIDGEPVALCNSYYPYELVKGTAITEMHRIKGGVHALIEDESGPIRRKISRSIDDIIARMPTPSETDILALSPGVPIIRVARTVYDSEDFPLEMQETIAAADRHELRYEVSMADAR